MLVKPLAVSSLVVALTIAAFAFPGPHAKISASQAQRAALRKYHGTVVGKVALENEDGKWEYSVNVRSGHTLREVMVDAHTGWIASVEVTTAREEAREAAAEAKVARHQAKKHK